MKRLHLGHVFIYAVTLVVTIVSTAAHAREEHVDSVNGAEDGPAYLLALEITQVTASISGNTSLTDDLGIRDKEGRVNAVSGPFSFYTQADLTIGDMAYRLDADGASWDGKRISDNQAHAKVLMSPKVVTRLGQSAKVSIGNMEPFQYMRRIDDDRFELALLDLPVGVSVEHIISPDIEGRVKIDPFVISVAAVQEREPIDGVKLNVGKPMLSVDKAELSLSFELGRTYGIQWRTKEQGVLLITVTVTEFGNTESQ